MIEHYIRGFEEELRGSAIRSTKTRSWDYKNLKPVLWLRKSCQWGYEVEQGLATTGVVSHVKSGRRRKVITRADMDALPIYENSGKATGQ